MTRALRAAWSRRGTLLPLAALVALVAGGGLGAVVLVRDGGEALELSVPLLILGAAGLPTCAEELARARAHEIGVARLRGRHGARMVAWLAAEPLATLVSGALIGLGVAAAVLGTTGRRVDSGSVAAALAVAAVVVAIGTAVVLASLVGTAAGPLDGHLVERRSTRSLERTRTSGLVILFVAAGVSLQRGLALGDRDPDWLVLAGPALLGLVAGQVAVSLLGGIGRLWSLHQGTSVHGQVTAPRLARLEHAGGVRLLVAGAVLACFALTGTASVSSWTDETSVLRAGAAQRIDVGGGALAALQLTRAVDPEGRWLMAAEVTDDGDTTPVVLVDSARYERVVDDFQRDTRAAGAGGRVGSLAPSGNVSGVQVATGNALRVAVERGTGGDVGPLRVTVTYLNDENYSEQLTSVVVPGAETTSRRLPRCAGGCALSSLTARGAPRTSYAVGALDFGGVDLTSGNWTGDLAVDSSGATITTDAQGRARVEASLEPIPVLRAQQGDAPAGDVTLTDGNGEPRPARVVATSAALPLVEGDGMLGDLPRRLARASPSGVSSRAMVLARADTPQDVVDAMTEATGSQFTDAEAIRRDTVDDVHGERARAWLLVGVLGLLSVVPVLLTGAGRARVRRRRDAAGLRLVGLTAAELRAAGRIESLLIAFVTAVFAAGAGALVVWAQLGSVALVETPAGSVPLETAPAVLPLLATAGVAALLVVLTRWPLARAAASGTPAVLVREEGR